MSKIVHVSIDLNFLVCWVAEGATPQVDFVSTHVWTRKDGQYYELWIRRRTDAPDGKNAKLRSITVASATRKFQTDDLDQDIPY